MQRTKNEVIYPRLEVMMNVDHSGVFRISHSFSFIFYTVHGNGTTNLISLAIKSSNSLQIFVAQPTNRRKKEEYSAERKRKLDRC